MSQSLDIDPISAPLREVLAVFSESLSSVRFPDVDASALAEAAVLVEQHAAEQRRLEAALEEQRKTLEESQEQLLQKAQRALAYARVFAEGDVLLSSRLEGIALPRIRAARASTPGPIAEAPKKQKKQKATDTTLFGGPDVLPSPTEQTEQTEARDTLPPMESLEQAAL